ncbi:hypothetical protein Tco_0880090, partial [Tanacetum coccineum]
LYVLSKRYGSPIVTSATSSYDVSFYSIPASLYNHKWPISASPDTGPSSSPICKSTGSASINSFGPGSYSYAYSVPNLYTPQVSVLPQAFQTMTLQYPGWNMDTRASSHLADNTGILTSFSNSSMYPSVFVGNDHSIPVTHTGHSFLHTSSKPLHLNHILVTPHIIKNLISVRQFTRDNDVSVEFDAYGFSVNDYQTGRLLLRCDSTGDLYPVTQRLGHPGDDVLRHLESRNLISCRKSKLSALCHACQLGEYAKLPFYNSESSVDSVFEIIHSDIWTSSILSDSNLDESTFLVTPFSDSNKDGCLATGDNIEILLHHDPFTPLKSVAYILEGFINDPPFEEKDDLECKMNEAPFNDAECFDSGGDNDEIDAFLAIEVPTYNEGYYDSEGDILYLESLLSEDTTHNLSPKVFFEYEPQQLRNKAENKPLITFSPKSDPLHHEFTGELITIPPGIVREHEDYINRMSLLCSNSFSQSPENFHTIIESLPTSTTLIEDSDLNREEIDIFSGPDDSIPPVINNVDELNEDECFDPEGGENNVEVDDSFTFVTWTFLLYGYIKNHKKTVKNGQARARESEENKKKPKNQSRGQKVKDLSQIQSTMVNRNQPLQDKTSQ